MYNFMCFTKNSYDRWLNVLELCLYFVLIMFYCHSPSYEFECQDSLWGEKRGWMEIRAQVP